MKMKKSNLNIAVVGAGGVGGYIATKLYLHTNHNITLIARGTHLKAIKQNGLKMIDNSKEYVIKINATQNPKDTIFDIVFLAIKSYSLKEVAKSMKDSIDENTLIIPLLNGVEHNLEKIFDKGIFLKACVYIISHIKEIGVVTKVNDIFYLIFGRVDDKYQDRLFEIKELLDEAKLKNKLSKDIVVDIWKKYLFIASSGLMTCYYKKPFGYLANEKFDEYLKVLQEIKLIANLLNVNLTQKDIEKATKQIKNIPFDSKTSMLIDIERKKESEIKSLIGYLIKNANSLNIPTIKKLYKGL